MEEIINIVVNNGLGLASFVALLYFVNKYMENMNETIEEISKTLTMIQTNLSSLQYRVDDIEDKIK